jgi:hypothetical protein
MGVVMLQAISLERLLHHRNSNNGVNNLKLGLQLTRTKTTNKSLQTVITREIMKNLGWLQNLGKNKRVGRETLPLSYTVFIRMGMVLTLI